MVPCAFVETSTIATFEGNMFQVHCDLTETGKFPDIDDEKTYKNTLYSWAKANLFLVKSFPSTDKGPRLDNEHH